MVKLMGMGTKKSARPFCSVHRYERMGIAMSYMKKYNIDEDLV